MKNHLIITKDYRLFVGVNERPATTHKHPVIQLVVAKDNKFKSKLTKSQEWDSKEGLLIRPNFEHQCDASNIPILSLEIDPVTTFGESILNGIIGENSYLDYPSNKFNKVNFDLIEKVIKHEDWESLNTHIRNIFEFQEEVQFLKKDARIENVVSFIHSNIHKTITTNDLIDVSFLSESRLLHLFKEQMGIPIRNYILWFRIKVASERIIEGDSLTTAAHAAGFSDQAHFSRSFVNMIGVPPSVITKNSKFIQVSFTA